MPDTSWLASGFQHIWLPYAQMKNIPMPLPVVGAEGARIFLADGRMLVDGIASWWTACHGYNHPHIKAAIERQLRELPHIMLGGLANEPAYRLAKHLAEITPGDLSHVFFSESGSVSVEIALKIALQYWHNKGDKNKYRFLAFHHAYHGDTMGTMSVCDPIEGMHSLFQAHLPQQLFSPIPSTKKEREIFLSLLREHHQDIAAIIIEPLVQGAGGMKFHDAETLQFIVRAAKEANVLLIADEIMTGFGRLGHLFACEEADIVPDIMTLSKALTGGTMPLAATIVRPFIFEAFLSGNMETILMHGPTYSGHALACRAALASLELFEKEPRLNQVKVIEGKLKESLEPLRRLKGIVDVRVKGALGIVQLDRAGEASYLRPHFLDRHVWVRPFGDIVYLAPPFVIKPDELQKLIDAMVDVLRLWSKERA